MSRYCFSSSGRLKILALTITAATIWCATARAQALSTQKNSQAEASTALITDGVNAMERNDLVEAKNKFLKAIELNPRDATAYIYLGIIEDRSGDFKSAETRFAAAVRADPRSPSAHNNHGASLLKLGRTKEAVTEFVTSLSLDRNQPNALVNLAQLRLASGSTPELNEALELFDRAFKLKPDAETARALVVVSLRLGKREAAANYYREYAAFITQQGDQLFSAASRAELGTALLENELTAEAILELTAAVSAEPSNAETIVRLGKAHLAAKNIPQAGRVLESAVARGIDDAAIYALLASVYEKSGHMENAIPAMRLAIQKDPQSEHYRFGYGMLLISALAPDAAVIRLQEALETFPNSSHLWLALGIAHFKAGRNDEAAKSLTHSIELDSKYAPAYVYLGMTHVETGQYKTAIQAYEHALAINGKLGIVNFLIADVMLKQTDADNAIVETHLLKAVKSDPEFAPARLGLGKLYLRTSRLAEAATEFENVIALDPNLAEAYYQLGLTYGRLKRSDESRASLEKFKQLTENQKEQALKDRKDIMNRLANVLF
jgi:superkiller protein 3